MFEAIQSEADGTREYSIDMIRLLLLQVFLIIDDIRQKHPEKIIPQQKQALLKNIRRLIDQHYLSIRLPKEYADLLYITPLKRVDPGFAE